MIQEDWLSYCENTAAGLARMLDTPPIEWGTLIATAQKAIGYFQQKETLQLVENLYDERNAKPLIAAARILHAASTSYRAGRWPQKEDDIDEATDFLMLASSAYAMYGNFPSAAAVQRELSLNEKAEEYYWLSACMANPSQIPNALSSASLSGQTRDFLEKLLIFLTTGAPGIEIMLVPLFEKLMGKAPTNFAAALVRCSRIALGQLIRLSVARNFSIYKSGALHEFARLLIKDQKFTLLPPQYEILFGQMRVHEAVGNSVVSFPTSAGKTLVAETCLISSLQSGSGIGLFVVPYVALGNQVLASLRRHAPEGITVSGYFGGFKDTSSFNASTSQIIVATPERIDAILRSKQIYDRLTTVVIDEAHLIENGQRGARMEGLVARMRVQQKAGHQFRILFLSAILTDDGSISKWLSLSSPPHTQSWRPTARRIAIWHQSGYLTWIYGNDSLRPSQKSGNDVLGRKLVPWPMPMYPTELFPQKKSQEPNAYFNAAYIARYLVAEIGGPILIVCGTKQTTRGLAAEIAKWLPELDSSIHRDAILSAISQQAPYLQSLQAMIKKGVAFHNASIPPKIRRLIEEAIRQKALTYVASTTTLAEGVDLPFRTTLLFDWIFGYMDTQRPLSPLLFRNIAGRCGRAGEYAEGDTVIFDNVLGPLEYTDPSVRQASLQSLFKDPPPLSSAIENPTSKAEEAAGIQAVVSSQLIAMIAENPTVDQQEEVFSQNLYSSVIGRDPTQVLKFIRADLLSNDNGEPFATAASPIQLTDLGKAVNATGLSPTTCRTILAFLRAERTDYSTTSICRDLLSAVGNITEQQNRYLRKITSTAANKDYVRRTDLEYIISAWLQNEPLHLAFSKLPQAVKSKASVKPSTWITGEGESEFVAGQFDKFIDLMEYTFAGFLPWMLRACRQLQAYGQIWAWQIDWSAMADEMETAREVDLAVVETSGTLSPET